MNCQNLETQLLRQPLPQISDHDSITWKHPQYRILESLKGEYDCSPWHRNATQRTNLPHPKPDVAVSQPDLCHLETDSSRDPFPDNSHLGGERIALPTKRKIADILARRKKLVEEPLHAIKIKCQVKPVPAGERQREEIGHVVSIGEPPPTHRPDARCQMPDAGCQMPDAGFITQT